MGALDRFGSLPERAAAAARAGCDLLFVCKQIDVYPACVEEVERSVPVDRRAEAAERLEGYAQHLEDLRRTAGEPGPSLAALRAELRSLSEG
jgi:beta-glucosidase-like glycosyl hydrolase